MSGAKQVSVVIASYNMGRYIAEALDSVLAQTYPLFEVIVVNDGSTDDTDAVVERFLEDPRIVYITQDNQGQPKAKNAGLNAARGEFVAFLDADDLWAASKIEKQIRLFEAREQVGVVYTNVASMDENGNLIAVGRQKRYSGRITEQLFKNNFVPFSSVLVRRRCFEEMGGFDESFAMGIDYELWLRLSTRYEFHYLDEVLYFWRSWGGQMSKNYQKRYENGIRIMNKFLAEFPDALSEQAIREAWAHTYVGRGLSLALREGDRFGAMRDYLKALQFKAGYVPAWKSMAKLIIP